MKDNFSVQAKTYAMFRPEYPNELIDFVLSKVNTKLLALDLATGNGQIAKKLSPHFDKVFATDISTKQLENAAQKDNIIYKLESAEQTEFEDGSFDLITIGQAVHWLDFSKFYPEMYRILKPDGIFAILGYGLLTTNPRADKIIRHLHDDILGPYWDKERQYVINEYKTVPFPFREIDAPAFQNAFEWLIEQLIGYLES